MNIYTVSSNELDDNKWVLFTSLQGLVNRHASETKELLYIDELSYLSYIAGHNIIRLSYMEAVKHFKGYIKCIVLYNSPMDGSINAAANIASICDGIMLEAKAFDSNEWPNYSIYDLSSLRLDSIELQELIFDRVKYKLNKGGIIHQMADKNRYNLHLRDFAISNRYVCMSSSMDEESKRFREKVLAWAGEMTPIYGWTDDEVGFVNHISSYGAYIVPADHLSNLSALEMLEDVEIKNIQVEKIKAEPEYHYLAITVSDGDNIQWLHRNFMTTSSLGQRLRSKMDYPLTFTISPQMSKLSARALNIIYSLGENNEFISGVSGIGYMNPCNFPKEYLDSFCKATSIYMKKSNLRVVTLLDNLKNKERINEVINTYAKYDDIIGGVYELDPTMYEGGKGKVFFSDNGKPFVSVRLSLWAPENNKANVSEEYINSIADRINSLPASINTMEGYSILNVHPWDIEISDLDRLVSKLDKHIKIVYTEQLINMLKENVKKR